MARRGRKPLAEPRLKINISLPTDMVARMDLKFMDPLKGQLAYGERSRYIESLIRQDEERHAQAAHDLSSYADPVQEGGSDEHN